MLLTIGFDWKLAEMFWLPVSIFYNRSFFFLQRYLWGSNAPYTLVVVLAWFNERTVQLRTLPLVPSPTGPHPARGDSGVCMCIHVCLLWSVFPTAFRVPHHLPVCRQLHTDSPAQLDSIWTWRNAHMRSENSSPTGDRTRVARLAVQCSTDWATPSSSIHFIVNFIRCLELKLETMYTS